MNQAQTEDDRVAGGSGRRSGRRAAAALALALALLYGAAVARTAWLAEDAYISLRTADNFLSGRGLTWNPGERVQAYTHPLWLLVLVAAGGLTGELQRTTLYLSIAVSLAAFLLVGGLARSPAGVALALAGLTLSRAYVDYSTSGLENPLSHLLIALGLWAYFAVPAGPRQIFLATLAGAGAMLTRPDLALLVGPPVVMVAAAGVLRSESRRRALAAAALGLAPLAAWAAFALVYYGFVFPNPAYAKLGAGLGRLELLRHGLLYLAGSLRRDPVSLLLIGLGPALALAGRDRRALAPAAGILHYIAYVAAIGGDFMAGRFLTAPLLAAAVLAARSPLLARRGPAALLVAAVVLVGGLWPRLPWTAPDGHFIDRHGIADERRAYADYTGLAGRGGPSCLLDLDPHEPGDLARSGPFGPLDRLRRLPPGSVVPLTNVGIAGFFAGPEVHLVDLVGLADPLLARLPALAAGSNRIGHFQRVLPPGYLESLQTGENRFLDPALGEFYGELARITRGPIWAADRWRATWRLNTGALAHLVDRRRYAEGLDFPQPDGGRTPFLLFEPRR